MTTTTDTVTLERLGCWRLYRVAYHEHWLIVPWFRVENAIVRLVREYHVKMGVGL